MKIVNFLYIYLRKKIMSLQSISKFVFEILIKFFMKEGFMLLDIFAFSLFKQYNKTKMRVQS